MAKILREIRKILGNDWDCDLGVKFYGEEIVFLIYESEIPIKIERKDMRIYIDTEVIDLGFESKEIDELGKILKVLEKNKEKLNEFFYKMEN